MSKTLCELTKLLKDDPEAFLKLVRKPSHYCRRCGRVAIHKSLVCKPAKLNKKKQD
jgi:hypothetical protein